MSTFEHAIPYVLTNEGVYSNDASDHGGATKYGITAAEAKAHGIDDVRVLTVEQAKAIYLADYWRFDAIDDQRVATKMLDMAANLGLATAVRLLQAVLPGPVKVDGVMGPATAWQVNLVHGDTLLEILAHACVRRYAKIIAADHSQAAFIVGWMERALRIPAKEMGQ